MQKRVNRTSSSTDPKGSGSAQGSVLRTWSGATPWLDAELEFAQGAQASWRTARRMSTPWGDPAFSVTILKTARSRAPGSIRITFPCDYAFEQGRSYEVSFLCRGRGQSIGIAQGDFTETGHRFRIANGWSLVKIHFVPAQPAAGPTIPLQLALGACVAGEVLHFGSILLRKLPDCPPLDKPWRVFLKAESPPSFHRIPSRLKGFRGLVEPVLAPAGPIPIDLAALAGTFRERDGAVLFNQFDCPVAGRMRFGVSADWWFDLHVNGVKAYDAMENGNASPRFGTDDHVFEFPVKQGRNTIAARVLAGSAGWRFVCGSPSIGLSTEPLDLGAAIPTALDSGELAGAVMMVVSKGGILKTQVAGWSDIAKQSRMRVDAMFWIASMSKPITALTFMMLVDEGKASLDDPVTKYIPEMDRLWVIRHRNDESIVLERQARPITIRQLLCHTSGLPFCTPLMARDLSALSLADAIKTFIVPPLESQPGEHYLYSNEGIDTVARVVEIVSGMPFEEFLNKRLLAPLGMKDTTFFPNRSQIARLAKAYTKDSAQGLREMPIHCFKPPYDRPGRHAEAGGGLFSTAADVARLCQMLLNGGTSGGVRYLSSKSLAALGQKQTGPRVPNKYGLGCFVDPDGEGSFGHGGAYGTDMTIYPKHGIATIWMVQLSGVDTGRIRKLFKQEAFRGSPRDRHCRGGFENRLPRQVGRARLTP